MTKPTRGGKFARRNGVRLGIGTSRRARSRSWIPVGANWDRASAWLCLDRTRSAHTYGIFYNAGFGLGNGFRGSTAGLLRQQHCRAANPWDEVQLDTP